MENTPKTKKETSINWEDERRKWKKENAVKEIKKIRKKLKTIERNRNTAFRLWLLYQLLDTGFVTMFILGFFAGLFQIIGIQDILPFQVFLYSHINYLMIGGIGGLILMGRKKEWAEKMWEKTGATYADTKELRLEQNLENQLKELERTVAE